MKDSNPKETVDNPEYISEEKQQAIWNEKSQQFAEFMKMMSRKAE